jgi:hypothetical protein
MWMKIINALRRLARYVELLLEVHLPMDVVAGLRTR